MTYSLLKEEWAGHVARIRARKGAYRVLVENSEERRQLGRQRRRWEDNIKLDPGEEVWGHGLDRSGSEYGPVVGSCECGNEPSGSLKCGEFFE
jgi:hypothetical protein